MKSSSKTYLRAAAFVGVLVLVGGLITALFDEARAVSIEFTSAPTNVSGSGTFTLEIRVPGGERVPIQRIEAIVEAQRPGQTDKLGSTVFGKASCVMSSVTNHECPANDAFTSVTNSGVINNIKFVGAFTAGGVSLANDATGYIASCAGTCSWTNTGYGYDTVVRLNGFGYGYGYKNNDLTGDSTTSGQGYGYGSNQLTLRFQVTIVVGNPGTHWLTVLAHTGSSTIATLSSPSAAFTAGGGGGGGGGGGPGDGGNVINVDATPITPPPGAEAAYTATGITGTAGDTLIIDVGDPNVPTLTIVLDGDLSNAAITIVRWAADSPPPGVDAIPGGAEGVFFLEITISAGGGVVRTMTIAVSIDADDLSDPDKAVLLFWDEDAGEWTAEGPIELTCSAGTCTGEVTVDHASIFAVAVDTQAPTIELTLPTGTIRTTTTIEAEADDNLGVVDKVDFFVDGRRAFTDDSAPFRFSFDPSTVEDGEHEIKATAYDFVGNTGSDSGTVETRSEGGPGEGPGEKKRGGLPTWAIVLIIVVLAVLVVAGIMASRKKKMGGGGAPPMGGTP